MAPRPPTLLGSGNFRDISPWRVAKRAIFDPVRRAAANARRRGRIPLAWCESANWGDALSPWMVERLSGRQVVYSTALHLDRYLAIGSILGDANEHAEIWGSGFIREGQLVTGPPRAVHAVRGPLSRERLLAQGVACPEIYGDPALLLPLFLDPDVPKRYPIGIIPHYADKHRPCMKACRSEGDMLVIDIEGGIEAFVRAVKSCELILSSSLHGLICADAFGVPRSWIRLSDAVDGGDFKFRDYSLALGEGEPLAIEVANVSDLRQAASSAAPARITLDTSRLLLSCPFLSDELRASHSRGRLGRGLAQFPP